MEQTRKMYTPALRRVFPVLTELTVEPRLLWMAPEMPRATAATSAMRNKKWWRRMRDMGPFGGFLAAATLWRG